MNNEIVPAINELCIKLGKLAEAVEHVVAKQDVDSKRLDEWDKRLLIGKTAVVTLLVAFAGHDQLRSILTAIGILA